VVAQLKIAAIPALNAEKTIAAVVIGCQKYVDEVVVCDDGSTDMTGEIAAKLGAKVLKHERNEGKGEALRTLFVEARRLGADAMVTLDADGQHYPSDIPHVLDALSRADIAIGSRFLGNSREVPGRRRAVNRILNAMTLDGITDTQSGFRAYGRKAIETITPSEKGMGVDSEILIQAQKAGLTFVEVPVSVSYAGEKTSTTNPIFHTLDVVFSLIKLTSIRHPLLFYGVPGLLIVVAGVYYSIITVLQVAQAPLLTSVSLVHGLVALSLLLIGLLILFTGVILFTLITVVRQRTGF
jgi:glycosyltransferase involved in cell wall biosynthesis